MARITVNETGTQPLVILSTTIGNASQIAAGNITGANALSVICLQDVTITASTGVFSWADFCSVDLNKLPTPADNEISMNVVIDPETYFGDAAAASGSAANEGMAGLSQNKIPVQFLVVWNNNIVANVTNGNISSNISANNTAWSSGTGFITNLAPTASPEAPVWVTPATLAVDGTMYNGYTT